jgi:hypothetical protein
MGIEPTGARDISGGGESVLCGLHLSDIRLARWCSDCGAVFLARGLLRYDVVPALSMNLDAFDDNLCAFWRGLPADLAS